MKRLGRFNMARLQAIEVALAELLPAPDYEAEFRAEEVFFKVTDEEIAARHGLDPEDPDYEPMLEFWRQHHRERGTYRRGRVTRSARPARRTWRLPASWPGCGPTWPLSLPCVPWRPRTSRRRPTSRRP